MAFDKDKVDLITRDMAYLMIMNNWRTHFNNRLRQAIQYGNVEFSELADSNFGYELLDHQKEIEDAGFDFIIDGEKRKIIISINYDWKEENEHGSN